MVNHDGRYHPMDGDLTAAGKLEKGKLVMGEDITKEDIELVWLGNRLTLKSNGEVLLNGRVLGTAEELEKGKLVMGGDITKGDIELVWSGNRLTLTDGKQEWKCKFR
jgi:hypothetical protein